MSDASRKQPKHRRLIVILSIIVIGMFFFGYALVPLYNVLCSTLGINGKSSMRADGVSQTKDLSRVITVQFISNNNANLPWIFKPLTTKLRVHPGENATLYYEAMNNAPRTMTVQAIPSITPGIAAKHFKKTECFCFTQQTLLKNQRIRMPLVFHVDADLPKNIQWITLSYTLFEVKKR